MQLLEDFIEKNKAANTVRKTKSDLNVWYRWCAGVNESRKLEELTPSELYHSCYSDTVSWYCCF